MATRAVQKHQRGLSDSLPPPPLGSGGRINELRPICLPLTHEKFATDSVAPFEIEKAKIQLKKILLLQGPVGPFFSDLHKALLAQGFGVQRVAFNSADRLFSTRDECVRFSGGPNEWETWLRFELSRNTPDAIVLFGSNRPAHNLARHIAEIYDINVISLEEGYLRAGYITCENGGNNQHSSLSHWQPGTEGHGDAHPSPPAPLASSFATMSLWGALYYLVRDIFSQTSDEALFHRRRERALSLAYSWSAHIIRRAVAKVLEARTVRNLRVNRGYTLVPLQVPSDSQLVVASRGWNSHRLINACLLALSRSGSHQRVVFKLHPLDRGGASLKRDILRRTRQLGLSSRRVQVLHTGRLGELARHASGMVVINSTSAFSALNHNVPVLVLGEAVYRHEDVVTTGKTEADVEAFFKLRHAKQRDVIDAFLGCLKAGHLIPGDFYAASGRQVAIAGIIAKINQLKASSGLSSGAKE